MEKAHEDSWSEKEAELNFQFYNSSIQTGKRTTYQRTVEIDIMFPEGDVVTISLPRAAAFIYGKALEGSP